MWGWLAHGDRREEESSRFSVFGFGFAMPRGHWRLRYYRISLRPCCESACRRGSGRINRASVSAAAVQRDELRRLVPSPLDFELALLQAAIADHHAKRNADQVGVLELHARRARRGRPSSTSMPAAVKLVVQLFGGCSAGRVGHFDRRQQHLVGGQRHRPDDAVLRRGWFRSGRR